MDRCEWICTKCRRKFETPTDAPRHIEGVEAQGLLCPWCNGPAKLYAVDVTVKGLEQRLRDAGMVDIGT